MTLPSYLAVFETLLAVLTPFSLKRSNLLTEPGSALILRRLLGRSLAEWRPSGAK